MDIKDFTGGPVVKNSPDNEGDKIQSLVWEDPTCHGAAKSVNCNYWAHTLEPSHHNYRSPRVAMKM